MAVLSMSYDAEAMAPRLLKAGDTNYVDTLTDFIRVREP